MKFSAFFIFLLIEFSISGQFKIYEVKKGDTLYAIGKMFHLDFRDLVKINNIQKIYAGQKIKIPDYRMHLIKSGESLGLLAQIYNVNAEDIKKINNLPDNTIFAGKLIIIPKAAYNTAKESVKNESAVKSISFFNSGFIWPADGDIISGYGLKNDIMNYGISIKTGAAQKMIASSKGIVVFTGLLRGKGHTAIISHTEHVFSIYCGMEKINIKEGTEIEQGASLGKIDSGSSAFFSIFTDGKMKNPASVISRSIKS